MNNRARLPRVVMSERLGPIGDIELRIAEETGADLSSKPLWTESDLLANGKDADVLIVGASEPVTAEVLAGLPLTRCIVRRGVGIDNVDVEAATRLGIAVAFVPDASVEEVSDQALALLLAGERGLFEVESAVRRGDVRTAAAVAGRARRFCDLTLGIVGFGRIGRALARKSIGIFGRVLASDPMVLPADAVEVGVELLSFEEVLHESDLISLHAPGGLTRSPLLDATSLPKLRPGARIVNTARGELVDEAALLEALAAERIAGASLDVTREEPLPAGHPLLSHHAVRLTGHTAGKGQRSSRSLREAVVAATIAALNGAAPANLASPDVLSMANNRLTEPATRLQ